MQEDPGLGGVGHVEGRLLCLDVDMRKSFQANNLGREGEGGREAGREGGREGERQEGKEGGRERGRKGRREGGRVIRTHIVS